MATFQQDLTALRIKTDRIEGELRNMITRDNLQDVISEAQRRFVDDGMWKDLAVAEMAKIRNEVEDVTRRAQAEVHQHGAVLQAADMGYQQTRRRQDAMEGMLTELRKTVEMVANPVAELRSAVEMITNKMSKMQDLEKDLERTKWMVEALRARPTGSSEDPAQAPQAVSSDGGTGMLGRIREAQRGWWHSLPDTDGLQ